MAIAVVLLSGCSGGSHSSATAPTTASTTTTSSSPAVSPAPTAVTSTSSTVSPVTTVAATTRCHTADLAITDDGGQGAAGTFFGTMVLRNVTSRNCTLNGYVGLQRLDAQGKPMPTTVQRTAPSPLLFTMQPQQQATFGYVFSDIPFGTTQTCSHATTVQVTPPDETTRVNVASTLTACDPQGIVRVGALRPGKLSYAQYSNL